MLRDLFEQSQAADRPRPIFGPGADPMNIKHICWCCEEEEVPADPDHIGLCAGCVADLRGGRLSVPTEVPRPPEAYERAREERDQARLQRHARQDLCVTCGDPDDAHSGRPGWQQPCRAPDCNCTNLMLVRPTVTETAEPTAAEIAESSASVRVQCGGYIGREDTRPCGWRGVISTADHIQCPDCGGAIRRDYRWYVDTWNGESQPRQITPEDVARAFDVPEAITNLLEEAHGQAEREDDAGAAPGGDRAGQDDGPGAA